LKIDVRNGGNFFLLWTFFRVEKLNEIFNSVISILLGLIRNMTLCIIYFSSEQKLFQQSLVMFKFFCQITQRALELAVARSIIYFKRNVANIETTSPSRPCLKTFSII